MVTLYIENVNEGIGKMQIMILKVKQILGIILFGGVLFVAGCGATEPVDNMSIIEPPNEDQNKLLYITEIDQSTEYDDPVYLNLSEMEEVNITSGGEYILSGECDKTIVIDAYDEIVHLFFDNVNVDTTIGPALFVTSAGKVVITLMQGSVNTLFDSAYYEDGSVSGAISADCDLTINGPGILYVCGYNKDAVYTKDVCKILAADVQLKAKRYGIRGNDGILINVDNLVIESEKNGCQTTNADKADKGVIDIRTGNISIVAGNYALSAASDVIVRGDEVYLNSVIGDIYTEGEKFIAEGVLIDG